MSQVFDRTTKTGDIVTTLPQASSIFKKYKIDFCCGGNRPLGHVIDKQQLDGEQILQELNELYQSVLDSKENQHNYANDSISQLVGEIIGKHHAYLKQHLPELSQFTTKIMKVHGDEDTHLVDLHRLFHELKAEMDQHMLVEETELFPLFLSYDNDPTEEKRQQLADKVQVLESEHDKAGELMREMRAITNDYTVPLMACMTYQLTFKKLVDMESDMFQHVHLENNILFKRVER